jgi:TRAP-type C4-dicarboxylate transport system permease small subunit
MSPVRPPVNTVKSVPVRLVFRLANGFAVAGGLLLCALCGLVVTSVIGRALIDRPVPGEFELVAIGTAIVIFLCLPYCQLQRGNVVVDLFLSRESSRLKCALDGIAAVLSSLLALLFAWRMSVGLVDAIQYRNISVILGVPLWWAYPPAVASFLLLAASCWVTAMEEWKRGA